MKNNKNTMIRRATVPFVALVVAGIAVPNYAFASEAVDASILIPKPSEFIPALIAFLVIWVLFAKFLWPTVLENLDARQKKIQEDLDSAEKTKIDSQRELEAYKAKIADADKKAEEIIAVAKREAEAERTRIKAQAQEEATEIIERAHEAVENERKSAMVELINQSADISIEMAQKILQENLNETKQHEIIEKYLQEVGSLNANK